MSLETEAVLDRRRMRRRLGLWRSMAILAAVAAIGAVAWNFSDEMGLQEQQHIARITVTGLIQEDRRQLEMLERLAKSKKAAGVLVFVNSPGGTTTGGEALFNALRKLSAAKPVVAQFGTVAASAAYIAGLGTDHIVARGNTITGSVGVIMSWPEFSGLLDKLGITMNEVKSGALKATPSPYKPLDEAGRTLLDEMIADGQRWFLGLVADRRKLVTATVPGLEQGRVYSGRRALELKLVDEIGGEAEALRWLTDVRKVPKGLKVVDWKPKAPGSWPLASATAGFLAKVSTLTLARLTGRDETEFEAGGPVLGLDGLVSVWHPPKN